MVKRVAIYCMYDKDGLLDGFRKYYLKKLRPFVERILVVVNGQLSSDSRDELELYADDYFVRENVGRMGGAWFEGMHFYGWNKLYEYDELLLLNDSFFGPIFPLEDFFSKCEASDADYYGEERIAPQKNFKGYGNFRFKHGHYRGSIGYFYVIKRKLLHSKEFKNYYSKRPDITDRITDTIFVEWEFFDYVIDCGFKIDTYQSDKYDTYSNFLHRYSWSKLIPERECIFLRHRPMTLSTIDEAIGPEGRQYGTDPRLTLDYIDKHTDYDVNLIWDYVLRVSTMTDIYKRFQLKYIVSDTFVEKPFIYKKRIAVIIHIYYADLAEECASYCENFTEQTDFYIGTTSEETKSAIDKAFGSRGFKHNCVIRPNGGADVPTLWVAFANIVTNGEYEYICYFHDHKAHYWGESIVGEQYKKRQMDNLFGSKAIVKNIINLFEDNSRLGVLGAPVAYASPLSNVDNNTWKRVNASNVEKLLTQLDINVPFIIDQTPVSAYGAMFWARTSALKRTLSHDWNFADFDVGKYGEIGKRDGTFVHAIERVYGFLAHDAGLYYADVISTDNARSDLVNYKHIVDNVCRIVSNDFTQSIGYELLKEKLINASKECSEVTVNTSGKDVFSSDINPQDYLEEVSTKLLFKKIIKRFFPKFIWNHLSKVRVKRIQKGN